MSDSSTKVSSAQPSPSSIRHGIVRRILLSPWLAVVIGAACYFPSLRNGFIRDDVPMVETNPRVKNLSDWRGIWLTDWWATKVELGAQGPNPLRDRLYRPFSLFTFALQYAIHGLNTTYFHAVNILLHAAMCWLVWRLARRITEDDLIAVAAALLFAVHPIHAEAVCEVVGRAEILAAIFLTGGLLIATPPVGLPGPARMALAIALFFLALLSKETAICHAPVLLAVWIHRRNRDAAPGFWRGLLLRLPLLAIPAGGYLALRFVALDGQLIRPLLLTNMQNPLDGVKLHEHIFGVLAILGHYVRLTFAPFKLSNDYGFAVINPTAGPDALTFLGAVAAAALLWLAIRWIVSILRGGVKSRGSFAGLLAILLLSSYLLISNGFVLIGVTLAERLFYWPSAIVCIGLAAFVIPRIRSAPSVPARVVGFGLCTLVLALFAGRSLMRSFDWRSALDLYRADHAAYPQNVRIGYAYAQLLLINANKMTDGPQRAQVAAEADRALERAIALYPRFPQALTQRGLAAELRSEPQKAVQFYESALKLDAAEFGARSRLDVLRGGGTRQAEMLEKSVQSNPEHFEGRMALGQTLLGRREFAKAIEQFEAAVRLAPQNASAASGLGQALMSAGRNADAIPHFERAIALDAADWRALTNLAAILVRSEPARALPLAQKAADMRPDEIIVLANLAEALVANGRKAEAVFQFNRVLAIMPAAHPSRKAIQDRITHLSK